MSMEAIYRGVRETERAAPGGRHRTRGRIAFVILVHMLYVARTARVLAVREAGK